MLTIPTSSMLHLRGLCSIAQIYSPERWTVFFFFACLKHKCAWYGHAHCGCGLSLVLLVSATPQAASDLRIASEATVLNFFSVVVASLRLGQNHFFAGICVTALISL